MNAPFEKCLFVYKQKYPTQCVNPLKTFFPSPSTPWPAACLKEVLHTVIMSMSISHVQGPNLLHSRFVAAYLLPLRRTTQLYQNIFLCSSIKFAKRTSFHRNSQVYHTCTCTPTVGYRPGTLGIISSYFFPSQKSRSRDPWRRKEGRKHDGSKTFFSWLL